MTCIFFGHKNIQGLDTGALQRAIEALIENNIDTFYVGHQGDFDRMVIACLEEISKRYPHVTYTVVLAQLPTQREEINRYRGHSLYPEGQEYAPPRFAVDRRNRWMIQKGLGGYCLCFVHHTWGGAYQFAELAKKKGLRVINLGTAKL